MLGRYSAYRRGPDAVVAPEVIDRILIGACAAVWLVLVGVSVAAVVALADLGRGFHKMSSDSHTTWVLYAVIIVSALIIAGAIPMLLRARHLVDTESSSRAVQSRGSRQQVRLGNSATRGLAGAAARRDGVKAANATTEWSGEAVDRIWLRGAVALTGAMGTALIAAAVATYLMAVGHDGASWVSYAFGGVITAGMPAIEWFSVRQLRRVVATP
ncbi:hypothetical protein MB901379_02948 [Mycobacterium basiliense]|uniref:Transmembrane protein n=1 Tax=Mycobacterium basiliense TaxID=2094119 RepID=A0A3S4FRX0_9MYCO|nr:DUF2561 family protein [Mycobacterium basiliense]VDM89372.1 hypothetical protein MB901379_02948 [Mycobacterium basiliense]